MAVEIRPALPGDRDAIRGLLSKTFGSPLMYDRFATGNPLGEPVAVVAQHDAAIVGFNMWNAWLVHTAEGPLTAYQSGASSVDESMRGRGLFVRLLRAGEELARSRGVELLFGFPNPASFKGFLKADWEHAGTLRLFACPLPSLGLARERPLDTASITSRPLAFSRWRYARAAVESRTLAFGDRRVTVHWRTERSRGVKIHKLLDVVDERGARCTTHLARVAAALPALGVATFRSNKPPTGLPWLPVRRGWDTPLILRGLQPARAAAMRAATYWYGDIDAS